MSIIRQLVDDLKLNNVKLYNERLSQVADAIYINDGTSAYIAVAPDVPRRKQEALIAHEAGHHFSGISGDLSRDEAKANRWATKQLISPEAIVEATLSGCQSYYELCEYLNVDEDFMKTAITCLRMIYGDGITIGEHYLHLYPIWVKNIKTGDIWPED